MKEARFRTTIALSRAALIFQFLLGTAVNLFVKIPTNHPGSNPPEYFGGAAAVGSRWRPGFIGVLGAGFNGGSFLNYHEDFSSMLMAVGFALAMSAYVALLYRSGIAPGRAEL